MAMRFLAALILVISFALPAWANPVVGEAAPDFDVVDSNGDLHSLSDYLGQRVILEWTNHDCPYVRKHYGSGNMQALQQEAVDAGYVWLSIISSAPGQQGYVSGEEANALTASRGAVPSAVLLDPAGDVGRLYDARTTPHMYVIDEVGTLRYMGAIDDQPTTRRSSVDIANNYVRAAMANLEAGEDVATTETTAYGCSVKY